MLTDPPFRGSRAKLILEGLDGAKFCYTLKFGFNVSNNKAKYKALIADIKLTKDIGAEQLQIFFRLHVSCPVNET